MAKREGRRVLLSDEALEFIKKYESELKKLHCKVNRSLLTSKIVEVFIESYGEKEKPSLEKVFFDQKLYLKSVLNGEMSEAEISASMKAFLKKVDRKKSKKGLEKV